MVVNGNIVEGSRVILEFCLYLELGVEIITTNGATRLPGKKVYCGDEGVVINVYAGDKIALVKWDSRYECMVPLKNLTLLKEGKRK